MQSSSTFVKISGTIPEVKKICFNQCWENIIAYWDECEQSEALAKKFGLFQMELEV